MNSVSNQKIAIAMSGYPGELISIIIDDEYLDAEKYRLFVNQFALHSDSNGSWRGEYWGKFVRGACACYKAKPSSSLYRAIEDSVFEMASLLEEDGTLSSYAKEQRLSGWDVWGRKYAMIGFLSYLGISKSKSKKAKILNALKKQANAFMTQVGKGKGKKGILETARIYGSLASASILGVYVDLYSLTGKKAYLDFAKYIISTGLCSTDDIIQEALKEDSYPYEWNSKKAYEMCACFQGLLRYGIAAREQKCIDASIAFARKVAESEFTITGGIGTNNEFFNHASTEQTNKPSKPGLETCVTVAFMGLFLDLLNLTKDAHYASLLETMSYNALFGAFNDLEQTMALSEGRVWNLEGYVTVPHEKYCFDSYSPLVSDRRCQVIGGFLVMQEGKTYGCCAANGGYGLGLIPEFAFQKEEEGYVLNFYSSFNARSVWNEKRVRFALRANLYQSGKAVLKIKGQGEKFSLKLRVPSWGKMSISLNSSPATDAKKENGYLVLDRVWNEDCLVIRFSLPLVCHSLNEKVAYTRGPIVLAEDARLDGFANPLPEKAKGRRVKNASFKNNLTVELSSGERLCDYSSAGKNMDDPHSGLTVWADTKK